MRTVAASSVANDDVSIPCTRTDGRAACHLIPLSRTIRTPAGDHRKIRTGPVPVSGVRSSVDPPLTRRTSRQIFWTKSFRFSSNSTFRKTAYVQHSRPDSSLPPPSTASRWPYSLNAAAAAAGTASGLFRVCRSVRNGRNGREYIFFNNNDICSTSKGVTCLRGRGWEETAGSIERDEETCVSGRGVVSRAERREASRTRSYPCMPRLIELYFR